MTSFRKSTRKQYRTSRRDELVGRLAGLVLVLLGLALLAGGCGSAEGRPVDGAGLGHAHRSPEAMARGVLAAIEADDREALERLLVTREEHRDLLWEQLPESGYMQFGEARLMNERNTDEAIRDALRAYGGRSFELVEIRFTGEAEVYDDFTLRRGARMRVRDESGGEIGELLVLDVVLEREGLWKPMHYVE